MAEFAYNNAKNTSTSYTSFKLNCGFHLRVSYKKDVNPHSKLKTIDQLATKLKTFKCLYKENLQHVYEFQKHYHN